MLNKLCPIISKLPTILSKVQSSPVVVPASIPILWFGDIEAYAKSKVKIVTVGLNPSCWEFKEKKNDTYQVSLRFPKASGLQLSGNLTTQDVRTYYDAMNEYFTTKPYTKWFRHNERVLNELNASYIPLTPEKITQDNLGKTFDNTAIHLDLYAPLATDPVWGELKKAEKNSICTICNGLYAGLIYALNPDIIVVAINQGEVQRNFINMLGQPCTKNNADFDSTVAPLNYLRGYKLNNEVKLIWGANSNGQPFSSVKNLSARMTQLKSTLLIP